MEDWNLYVKLIESLVLGLKIYLFKSKINWSNELITRIWLVCSWAFTILYNLQNVFLLIL